MEPIWLQSYPKDVPPTSEYPDISLFEMFRRSVEQYPKVIATHFHGRNMTYRDLSGQVERCAGALHALGVKPGDRVGLVLPNSPQFVIAYYAALRLGAVAVANNPLYTVSELTHQLTDAGCRVVVTWELFLDKVLAVPVVEQVIVTGASDALPFPKNLLYPLKAAHDKTLVHIPKRSDVQRWGRALAAAPAPPPMPTVRGNDLAALVYTGGTTGVSKGVMLTHRNLVVNAHQAALWDPEAQYGKERMLAVLPFFHCFGQTVCMHVTILWGGTLILMPRFELEPVLDTIQKQRPTMFPAVPTIFIAINNRPGVEKLDLTSLRSCFSGAAPLPAEVAAKFESLTGATIIEGYGLTETSPIAVANPPSGVRKPGTIGMPLPDTTVKLADLETGEEVSGQPGELCIRGPQVMAGYWQRPEATAEILKDGWLYTGDVATVDEDGYFTIVDRKKEMVITGGFNVYPREVEEVLYAHPAVREAAVIGVPDAYSGEAVKAYVALKEGASATEDELRGFCRERMGAYKVPKTIEFRDELPKSVIGKVLRRKLKEELTG